MNKLEKAVAKVNRQLLRKQAGVTADILAGIPANMAVSALPGGSTATLLGGMMHGAVAPLEKNEKKKMNENWGLSFLPGVGTSRLLRRARLIAQGSKHGVANIAGEQLGGYTAPILPILGTGAVGAAIGGVTKGLEGAEIGGLVGAGVGAGLVGIANLAAVIAAGVAERRTKQQQRAYDDRTAVENWLLPGANAYNALKRVGRMYAEEEDTPQKKTASARTALTDKSK